MSLIRSCLLALIISVIGTPVFGQDSVLTKNFLTEHVRPIKSIDPTYRSTEDLDFLKTELAGVDIVMLGEQSHGDGASFLAKARLIKYLHEVLDFDVLVFESGLVDCHRVWKAIEAGGDSLGVFDLGVFPVWTQSQQVAPVFDYVLKQSKTPDPLMLAGFDIQPTGVDVTMPKRFEELQRFLQGRVDGFDKKNYPTFFRLIADPGKAMREKPTTEQRRMFEADVARLERDILAPGSNVEAEIMARSIRNLRQTFYLFWNADLRVPGNTPHVFNIRDKGMAENMTLLKEKIWPGKKMIVWGANTHIGYGRGFLGGFNGQEAADPGMVPMGQYLKIDYGDAVYTISFTSYEGDVGSMRGDIFDVPAAAEGTLEEKMSQMPIELGFLSLRNEALNDERFATRLYGHSEMMGRWSKMTDAIFYIKTMTPSTKRK